MEGDHIWLWTCALDHCLGEETKFNVVRWKFKPRKDGRLAIVQEYHADYRTMRRLLGSANILFLNNDHRLHPTKEEAVSWQHLQVAYRIRSAKTRLERAYEEAGDFQEFMEREIG